VHQVGFSSHNYIEIQRQQNVKCRVTCCNWSMALESNKDLTKYEEKKESGTDSKVYCAEYKSNSCPLSTCRNFHKVQALGGRK
jgi:hypothetical protein